MSYFNEAYKATVLYLLAALMGMLMLITVLLLQLKLIIAVILFDNLKLFLPD